MEGSLESGMSVGGGERMEPRLAADSFPSPHWFHRFSYLAEGAKCDAPAASSKPSPVRLQEPAPSPRDPEQREDATPGRRLEDGRGLSLTRQPPQTCFPSGSQKSGDKIIQAGSQGCGFWYL